MDVVGATFNNVTCNFCIPVLIDYTTINVSKNHLGYISITPISGIMPLQYLWEDGISSQNRSELASEYYQVTIIDSLLDTTFVTIPVGTELEWANVSNVIIRNQKVEKTANTEGFGIGLATINNILERGTVQATVYEINSEWAFGFRQAANEQAVSQNELDYGFYVNDNNQLFTIERNSPLVITEVGTIAKGDVLSIEKTTTTMVFKKNGETLRQVDYITSVQYRIDITLSSAKLIQGPFAIIPPKDPKPVIWIKSIEANVQHILCYNELSGSIDLTVTGAGPFFYIWTNPSIGVVGTTEDISNLASGAYSVTIFANGGAVSQTKVFEVGYATFWKKLVNTASDGNNLAKHYYANQDWNAGASSNNKLSENTDGWASFTLESNYSDYQEHGTIWNNVGVFTFGLSQIDNGVDYTTIEYGIRIMAGNYWLYPGGNNVPMQYVLVENGNVILDAFSVPISDECEIGDVFTIERIANGAFADIIYKKNGIPIYISSNQPYDVELITDASIFEGIEDFTATVPVDELGQYSLPQIVNAASSFMCNDDPTINYKANAWVKLIPPFIIDPSGGNQQLKSLTNNKRIGETSDVITGSKQIKFVYELWNEDYSILIETKEWYLLDLNDEWTFYQIEFQVTKQFEETNMLVYIKNDEVKSATISPSLFIDDLVIYPAEAKYSYTSNDKFGNATYVTDVNENHSQVIYDEWARPIINIDAMHNVTNTYKYHNSNNLLLTHSYNEVTKFVV